MGNIMTGNQTKKEKIWNSNKFLHKSPFKKSYTNGIHSLQKPVDATESDDIIYLIHDAYR